ncbi:unnamed protein product [Lupinus luteus]|uniref:Endoglucanase n=1 Tax=Lupinus luteus TaxID=3873 RepID=A0AAV1XWJ6_LUPLU
MLHLGASVPSSFNYGDALDKSLMFFEAQRSGKLPVQQRVKWRGDSGLNDGLQQGLFTFADKFRGLYDEYVFGADKFYSSSGYSDELLWAAAWLFHATDDEYYLNYVVDNAVYMGGTGWAVREFSWDNKYAGVQILLSKVLFEGKAGSYASTLKQYQAKADYYACACLQKNDGYNVHKTPGGLVYVREWNNLQYVSSAAFLSAVYSNYLFAARAQLNCPEGQIQPQELINFAKSQADYILGKNPKEMSYLIGYGSKYPLHVHHRGASIASIFSLHSEVGCVKGFEIWYSRPEPNPNVLFGGLVGGPDENDDFSDERSNYEQTEPTTSGSAPLIGIFAKLQSLYGNTGSYQYHKESLVSKPTSTNLHQTPTHKTLGGPPVEFLHSITSSWTVSKSTYYRHKVVIKNISQKPITDLKLVIDNLSGTLWGLTPTKEKNTYELPQWLKVLEPGTECTFVYVQGGPQAKISIQSFH